MPLFFRLSNGSTFEFNGNYRTSIRKAADLAAEIGARFPKARKAVLTFPSDEQVLSVMTGDCVVVFPFVVETEQGTLSAKQAWKVKRALLEELGDAAQNNRVASLALRYLLDKAGIEEEIGRDLPPSAREDLLNESVRLVVFWREDGIAGMAPPPRPAG